MMVGWLTDRLTDTPTGNYCWAALLNFSRKHPYVSFIHTHEIRSETARAFRHYRQLVPKYNVCDWQTGRVERSTPGSVRVRHGCVEKTELRSESGDDVRQCECELLGSLC